MRTLGQTMAKAVANLLQAKGSHLLRVHTDIRAGAVSEGNKCSTTHRGMMQGGVSDADQFRKAFDLVLERVRVFKQSLTPREIAILQIGMRASRAADPDEALAQAHLEALAQLISQLPPR